MNRPLKGIIADQIEVKGITLEKLASQAQMSRAHLDAIMNQQPEKLPPFPYVRTELIRLAEVLDLNPEEILSVYREQFSEKLSGEGDILPHNRFAVRTYRKWWLWVGAGILVFLIYIFLNSGVFGTPYVQLLTPPSGTDPYVVYEKILLIKGQVEPGDTVTINQQSAIVDDNGVFSYEYALLPELNSIEIRVKRFLGKEITIRRQVFYDAAATSTSATSSIPAVEGTSTTSTPSGL